MRKTLIIGLLVFGFVLTGPLASASTPDTFIAKVWPLDKSSEDCPGYAYIPGETNPRAYDEDDWCIREERDRDGWQVD